MHLLLGHPSDSCCGGVLARLEAYGSTACIVASPLAPPARLIWRLDNAQPTSRLYWEDQEVEVAGVLVRGSGWVDPAGWAQDDHAYMQAEMLATTLAWLGGLSCPVINRSSAALWYRGRASIADWRPLLRRCGLAMPEVLITNEPTETRAFRQRLVAQGLAGAVYTPLTGEARYLLATNDAWHGLEALHARTPVCLSEPHGAVRAACIVGGQVIWDNDRPLEAAALEPQLRQFASEAGLDFVEIAVAPLRHGLGVVMVDPMPVLEHFTELTRCRILDELTTLLRPATSRSRAALETVR